MLCHFEVSQNRDLWCTLPPTESQNRDLWCTLPPTESQNRDLWCTLPPTESQNRDLWFTLLPQRSLLVWWLFSAIPIPILKFPIFYSSSIVWFC